ncbi:hypothetical protein BH20ACT9_BH20ACT9_06090 [soil metagenome]
MLDVGERLPDGRWSFPFWPRHPSGVAEWGTARVPVGTSREHGADGRPRTLSITPTHPRLGRPMVREDVPHRDEI